VGYWRVNIESFSIIELFSQCTTELTCFSNSLFGVPRAVPRSATRSIRCYLSCSRWAAALCSKEVLILALYLTLCCRVFVFFISAVYRFDLGIAIHNHQCRKQGDQGDVSRFHRTLNYLIYHIQTYNAKHFNGENGAYNVSYDFYAY